MIRNFKTLMIWQRSRTFVKAIYHITKTFPKDENFGLTSQLNRAAVSIPSHIAEGCGRNSLKDLSRFLDMANGSSCEVETQLYLAFDLNYINRKVMEQSVNEMEQIRKMIVGYQKTLK